ncbi:hypothetical protein Hypma_010177 [Hypsizygus marmoreus]|uniref:Uncharacterized protein n=1 Tax=Hypsizygus marmoreus TaxID=39966 RepID=A0A369JT22_HYPMA|nr:hypothetical protein Hypma_010177 [Hypsizygus marmoreus]
MSSKTAPADDSQLDAIWQIMSKIPESICADVIQLLEDELVTTKADSTILEAFVNAANAVTALPCYKAIRAAATAPKHCVRCHDTFTEEKNDSDSCVIPHVFSECTGYGGAGGPGGAYYEAKCCGAILEEYDAGGCNWLNLATLGKCYKGYHTEDIEDVENDRSGGYNKVNIPRCEFEDGECVAHGYEEGEDPVFDC